MIDDTARFNWLLEALLTRTIPNGLWEDVTGIPNAEMSCPGHVSLGERVREIIDTRISSSSIQKMPFGVLSGQIKITPDFDDDINVFLKNMD